MSGFASERRGISWKDRTLNSASPPPLPLLLFFGLLLVLLYFASWSEYRERIERKKSGFRFGFLLLPLAVAVVMNLVALRRSIIRQSLGVPTPAYEAAGSGGGGSTAGLVVVLVMLLVLVRFQSSVQSGWFKLF